MSYKALYREWRPLAFKDVVEQEHVVKTLKNSVVNDRIAHAYLFCGTRGTGKTTMAKIFSRAINCLNPHEGDPCNECEICTGLLDGSLLDVLEIDAASNNSVENVRQIRDEVAYSPARARFKVYIIDEVHMLSSGAFNALLKTLEEPPSHVVFILATTDPHKLPVTVLSRCQRFDFRRISVESIMGRLELIAKGSDTTVEDRALMLLARLADGALRDGISLLDQCISIGKKQISYDDVLEVAGIVRDDFVSNLVDAVENSDNGKIISMVDDLVLDGKDLQNFVSDLIGYYRNIYLCRLLKKPDEVIHVASESLQRMKNQCSSYSDEMLTLIIKELSAIESALRWALSPRIMLEVSLIGISKFKLKLAREDMEARLIQLEARLERGEFKISGSLNNGVEGNDQSGQQNSKQSHLSNIGNKYKQNNQSDQEQMDQDNQNHSRGGNSSQKLASHDLQRSNSNNQSDSKRKPINEWHSVVSELYKSNKPILIAILEGSKASFIEENVVGIFLSPDQAPMVKLTIQKPENKNLIETLLSEKLGREITIKCFHSDEKASESKSKDDPFMKSMEEISKRAGDLFKVIE